MTAQTSLTLFKSQLNLDHNLDDDLLTHKLAASEYWIANHTGIPFDAAHPVMVEAALQLASYWYEQREAASDGRLVPAPFSVHALLNSLRESVVGNVASA